MLDKKRAVLAVTMACSIAPLAQSAEQTTTKQTEQTPSKPSPKKVIESPDNSSSPTKLAEVTVSSTRTERRTDSVPSTVTVTTAAQMEAQGARDLKDVFNDELDVTVPRGPTKFTTGRSATGRAGNDSINVRGLEGNQVLMLQDGIRVPNSFSFGPFATGRADFIDVDGLKTVEVLRGPASTQYGSDGLAGAVIFRTLNPNDLLKPGSTFNGFARASYAGIDHSWNTGIGLAGHAGPWQTLLVASYRQGHEVDNMGDNTALNVNRTAPNPVDYRNPYGLAKLLYQVSPQHQLGLTLESQRRTQDTEVYSARNAGPLTAKSTTNLSGSDKTTRDRVSVNYQFNDANAPWIQRIDTSVYWQDANITQDTEQQFKAAATSTTNNVYQSTVRGFSGLAESNLSGTIDQRITYGIDWSRAQITSLLNGTNVGVTQQYPFKPFPDSTYELTGAFVQDEIQTGAVSIIPALRFDHYSLSPSNSGYEYASAGLSGSAVTPRLGLVWQLAPSFAPYGQIARGFRAPTPDQVNNGFSNLAYGYTSVGNPNLKPEHANSVELGVRGKINSVRYAFTVYDNRYTDFISQQVVSGSGTRLDPLVFQYINLAQAHIHGVEARSEWMINSAWSANAGVAYSKGDSETRGVTVPLNTVQPVKAVLGLRFNAGTWEARANVVHSAGKDSDQIAPAKVAQFAPPAFTVLDIGATYKPLKNLSLNLNINNLFNTKYWRWSDVNGLAANSPVTDAYSATGRYVQASVRYDF